MKEDDCLVSVEFERNNTCPGQVGTKKLSFKLRPNFDI